ncbi:MULTISPECIES: ornithine cyclodeaminase family protein [unclassified Bradyrhizobium]|uniref:ornithine cyclodeaminase family protein n=1 Tax=unclassified Bradyrhizobium TaxID=2631580 RepID=UPI00247AE3A4|nr:MULTISPECIES: ornithine cyclodeaminase family protein [unclassified Bradyrhizobium]WGR73006.1 ornithine cyclodeaminase family protein [Bradyrhizobium sp. ISRA426]WGR77841.1 ornithine cyclodeaminase family protein [Bradyrhizobium sp. ISRA430]WGR88246.1 ornithine cyclodeaminase family protein [Bradyrhizobium sp. ISRA432]
MASDLLYLSNAHVQELQITAREAREAVLAGFRDNSLGRNVGLPKSPISIGPGSWFISMNAVSEAGGIGAVKMVAVASDQAHRTTSRVNGLVCVSDYKTGVPLAVMDGNSITLIRTAATSALAAVYLAPEAPVTIGFVGCGQQALSHLDAFVDAFPSLRKIHLLSRSGRSAERVAVAASEKRLEPIISEDPNALVSQSEIVVSMVPSSPGLTPFLDARLMPPSSFAAAVDGARSWVSEGLSAFDRLVTDSLEQSKSPVDASGQRVKSARFQDDLVHLASGSSRPDAPIRALFAYQGFVIADLALAELAIQKARALGIGTILPL